MTPEDLDKLRAFGVIVDPPPPALTTTEPPPRYETPDEARDAYPLHEPFTAR